jgi:hypothetical protein
MSTPPEPPKTHLWPATLALALAISAGCATNDPATNSLASARAAIGTLKLQLRQRLQLAMADKGPAHALDVCAGEAQAIRNNIAHTSQTQLGRSSLRLRTPADAPPEWVKVWLDAQGERPAAGVQGFARIDETPDGPVARVLEPIAIDKGCIPCHGKADKLGPGVADALSARYPGDAATGYADGDLRGAIWAEKALR